MAAIFGFAAIVQYNDPDPVTWMIIYSAACAVSAMAAMRKGARFAAAATVGAVACAWGLAIALRVPALDVYLYMFDAWEMRSASIEHAREATGLFLTAAWMVVIALQARSAR